jgi:hypothetical protein
MRVYLLKHIKRSGVDLDDVLHFYYSVVRPVLEYACHAWHTGLTRDQSDRLEAVQKRSLSIIFDMSVSENNEEFCSSNGTETLANRRDNLCKRFFLKCVANENNCLPYLLPASKENDIANKLRNRPKYYILPVHTA